MAQRGQGSCEYCSNYVYDEEYEYYCCDVSLDEDEMAAFSGEIQRAVRIFRWRTSIRLCGNRCKTIKRMQPAESLHPFFLMVLG